MSATAETPEMLSLCSFTAGGRLFGIETRTIREVAGAAQVLRVPLAPAYIGGIISYRGEVLTALCLPALLGKTPVKRGCPMIVLDGDAQEPRFALLVEGLGGVVSVQLSARSPNPSTLDEAGREIFVGAFRTGAGLLVQLDPERLRPAHLAVCGLFGKRLAEQGLAGQGLSERGLSELGEMRCGL